MIRDITYAFRAWRRYPGFAATVVLVLALGIGANSAIFTFVNALLFRPLPGRVSQLVGVYSHDSTKADSYRDFSYPGYVDVRARSEVFDGVMAHSFALVGRPSGDTTRRSFVELVSSNYFDVLGVPLTKGRPFTLDEERPGANSAVVIASFAAWRDSGFDPGFVGRTLRINTRDFTIVGVAPDGFTGTTALLSPELWLPLGVFDSVVNDMFKNGPGGLADRANMSLNVAAHLRQGIGVDQANARLTQVSTDLERAHPAENAHQVLSVNPLSRISISTQPATDSGPMILSAALMPLSGAVLLIACLNVANMLLARSLARRREIAVRLALGARRTRIVRQLLTESFVLSLVGAAAGLMLGAWTTRLIMSSLAPVLPISLHFEWRPDLRIVLVTLACAVASVLTFGLGPALRISRGDLIDDLKNPGGAQRPGRAFSARGWLVVCQIAVSLTLMTAGGLFARGALRAGAADPGYRYDGLLLASIDPSLAGYDEVMGRARLRAVLEKVRSTPGVIAASANSQVPFGDFREGRAVERPGKPVAEGSSPSYTIATADYFKTINLPILRGREFSVAEESSSASAGVAIIDEPFARRLFPDEDPVGQTIRFSQEPGRPLPLDAEPMTIVGVVPGVRDELFDRVPSPHLYVPSGTHYRATMHVHVRVSPGSETTMLAAVRAAIKSVDDRLPVVDLRTMADFHNRGVLLWAIRAAGRTLSGLGGLALLLAVVGVYGVKSYVVSQRTREIGIRLALGASPRDVGWMLFRDGAKVTLIGIAIGLPLAIGLGVVLSSAIFEVQLLDPVVLLAAPLVLVAAAGLATYLPARRGRRVSPLEALRVE